jgi:hypothetical protein
MGSIPWRRSCPRSKGRDAFGLDNRKGPMSIWMPRVTAGGTHAQLLLAFWASIGFKPGDFMTIGMNEKRTAWLCRVLNRVTHPA